MATFDALDPVGPAFRDAVSGRLTSFMAAKRRASADVAAELAPLVDQAALFTTGGKRLRPAFCYWAAVAIGGEPDDAAGLLDASASLDLLHVSALMHDDVMDASDTRRGVPASHRQFEALHVESGWLGSPEAFGRAGAILLGDLLLMWSAELFAGCGLPGEALRRAEPLLDAVRTEVTYGQFLDIRAQAQPLASTGLLDAVHRVVEYKTARYTVVRPTQIGAALAGATTAQLDALAAFGSPLGRAFQFRDDVLGIFGDSALTGKPAGDDLREGKRTVLIAHALHRATPAARERLAGYLGSSTLDATGLDDARAIITDSGALAATEREIAEGFDAALAALADVDLTADGRTALTRLAELAVRRDA